MHKILVGALAGVSVAAMALPAYANCDKGEIHIKFSHVTNTDKHPKGIAATLLRETRQRRDERQGLHDGLPEFEPLR